MRTFARIIMFLFILTFGYFASCSKQVTNGNSNLVNNETDSIFKIKKIDSINGYYLVYAKRANKWFKIVSKKEKTLSNLVKVKVNNEYRFSLHSVWNQPIMIGGINVSPSKTPHVTCLGFDKETNICIERDSINDLFTSKNLHGLQYKK